MRKIVSMLLSACLLFSLCACGPKADISDQDSELSWQEQYDLGVRYLSEGNYEEAIIAFKAAIKIDSKKADPYLGLADAYVAMGDEEQAISVLADALDLVDAASEIQRKLDSLREESQADMSYENESTQASTPNVELSPESPTDAAPEALPVTGVEQENKTPPSPEPELAPNPENKPGTKQEQETPPSSEPELTPNPEIESEAKQEHAAADIPDTNEQPQVVVVTFDPNGGEVSLSQKSVTIGEAYGALPTPTRAGFEFLGWYTNNSVLVLESSTVLLSKDETLYAQWEEAEDMVAAVVVDGGSLGSDLSWNLDSRGVLSIQGSGKMPTWRGNHLQPWASADVLSVIIENGVQNIGSYSLAGCSNATSISIADSVTEIGAGALSRMSSLSSVKLPQSLETIGGAAFSNCDGLSSIVIPRSVNYIEAGAFRCKNLQEIYFCGDAPSYFGDNGVVEQNMFSGGSNLTVYYPETSTGWDAIIEKYSSVTWSTWIP